LTTSNYQTAYDRSNQMSTLAFAAFTNKREEAEPGTSSSSNPPGVSTYVDALAALVPAEVLTLHALILPVTTTTAAQATTTAAAQVTTTITNAATLRWAFAGLILLSIVLYVVPRFKNWVLLDYVRVAIPPLAFVAWTMLQRSTAFDAIAEWSDASRTVAGLFLAVLLGLVAATLARKADENQPPVNG
jgi:hypothetical protein